MRDDRTSSSELSATTGPDTGKDVAIVWFRKDLRLADNHALSFACQDGRPLVALYIREPAALGTGPLGSAQAWWLHRALEALGHSLEAKGIRLILRSGDAFDVLSDIAAETGAATVCWNRRYDPRGVDIDRPLKERLTESGLSVRSFSGQLLHEPSKLKTATGGAYRVYTPFWKALSATGEPEVPFDAPQNMRDAGAALASEPLSSWSLLPTKPDWAATFDEVWTPGEAGALEKLDAFVNGPLDGYEDGRDRPADGSTSMLSPHLALGEIAPARLWHAVSARTDAPASDIVKFRKEVVWRDFSYHLLFHNPDLATKNINASYDSFPWKTDAERFSSWTRGETGYPIVDAGMRQLWRHGYMHNRVRMIAASFLIKDLLIDWREGEAWFRDTLVDADPASNAASWQWVAGSGADAAPFFRIFNPILQGEKFDPDGQYVKAFVPELKNLDPRFVHKPFDAPAEILSQAGITLGKTYPKPIVDHARARDRALAAYKNTKDAA